MALDATRLIDDAKIAECLKNPLNPQLVLAFFGIPVIVSDAMPPGKVAFVSWKPLPGWPFREIADIKVIDVKEGEK